MHPFSKLPWLITAMLIGALHADMITNPIGLNSVTCLPNSDTIVGVPFRSQGSRIAKLDSAPEIDAQNPDRAIIRVTGSSAAGSFENHYLKFISGTHTGRWYNIPETSSTSESITIDLDGDTLTGVTSADSVVIAEYWTLDTLFPVTKATTSWTETPAASGNWKPNGEAIVSSNSNSGLSRRTEILIPDLAGTGINLSPIGIHFISGTTTKTWMKAAPGGTFAPSGGTVIYPNTYFTIRHNATVAHPTNFVSLGEVETVDYSIPLFTSAAAKQDNHIAIPRPLPLKLSELGLAGTPAFTSSASSSTLARRDELLVFDNSTALRNRVPSTVYFTIGGAWKKLINNSVAAADNDIIPAGHGIVIRKAKNTSGSTVFWQNHPTF